MGCSIAPRLLGWRELLSQVVQELPQLPSQVTAGPEVNFGGAEL